ncbi:TauD/TfdA family dioxygenase [Bacillus vallismortis]|nr:TauD/TfdA family dioxygenase [Bacillus vallismortis]
MFVETLNSGKLVSISPSDQQNLFALVEKIHYSQSNKEQNEEAISQINMQKKLIPPELKGHILEFVNSDYSYLLLKNLPQTKCDELLLLLTSLVGDPFAHADEGSLIMANKPIKIEEAQHTTAYFTWNKFDLHTELPYIQTPPDFISLYCVNNVKGGYTYLSNVERALHLLSQDQMIELKKPQYTIPIPPHFGADKKQEFKRPLLSIVKGRPSLRIRQDGLVSETEAGMAAAQALQSALDMVREAIELEPGSLIIINNHLSAHGRAPFRPTFNHEDRELHRVYLIEDVNKFGKNYDPIHRRIRGF